MTTLDEDICVFIGYSYRGNYKERKRQVSGCLGEWDFAEMQVYLKTTTDFEVHANGLDLFTKFSGNCMGERKNHTTLMVDYVLRKTQMKLRTESEIYLTNCCFYSCSHRNYWQLIKEL